CRIVAGSANNQLAEPEDAERLDAAGILYAPDYVINAGGVLQLLGLEDLGWDEAELERNLAGIGDTLRGLYRDAAAAGITPALATLIASLNTERAANGLPGRLTENPSWSEKCARHIAYMGSTGTFGHSEDPANPAYTTDGNWAGENSVLAMGTSWPTGDPFAN